MAVHNDVFTRERTLEFSALNIAAQPHPSGAYVSLFRAARKLRRAVKIISQDFAELSPLQYTEDRNGKILTIFGTIYRFTKIDEAADWFDTSTGEPATDEARGVISIPKNLRPNTRLIHWVFDVKTHTLVFVSKNGVASMSPNQAESFFQTLMKMAVETIDGVDYVDVTTVKSTDAIDRIFSKKVVSSLVIDIKLPNPDGPQKAAAKIYKAMNEEGVRRRTEKLTAAKGGTVKKSERISDMLDATIANGKAEAITYDETGEREEINTVKHPLIEAEVYDPSLKIPLLDFIADVAEKIVMAFRRRK